MVEGYLYKKMINPSDDCESLMNFEKNLERKCGSYSL